jgi:hypothetical protein
VVADDIVAPTDLVGWLCERLDEDERLAQAAIDEIGGYRAGEMYPDGSGDADYDAFPSYPWGSDARELAFMAGPAQPARVLREVAAKRAILELHVIDAHQTSQWRYDPQTGEPLDPEWEVTCAVCGWSSWDPKSACPTLLALAAPFSSEPGWDPSWTLEG